MAERSSTATLPGVSHARSYTRPPCRRLANLRCLRPNPRPRRDRRLPARARAEREKAARDLEALGPPALKALKTARASADEEVRARAKVISDRIELAERSRRLLEAPKLSFMFAEYPLDLAITEFAKQTGLQVSYSPGPGADAKRKITLDTGPLPYWEAVHAFFKAAGLTEDGPFPEPAEKKTDTPADQVERLQARARMQVLRTRLSPRQMAVQFSIRLTDGETKLPAIRDRALRIRALPATFAGNKYDDVKGELTLHLDVDPTPTLNLQDIVGVEVRHAAAEDGRPLAAAYPDLEPVAPLDYAFTGRAQLMLIEDGFIQGATPDQQVQVVLKTAGLRPRALSELSGVIVARVLTPPEPLVTVEKLLDAKGQTAAEDGYSLTVVAIDERAGNKIGVRARLTTTPMREDLNFPVLIKGQARQFINIVREIEVPSGVKGFEVRTADGKPVPNATTTMVRGTSAGGFNQTEVLILFPKPGDKIADLHLAYTARRSALVELPFTLKDVPVP